MDRVLALALQAHEDSLCAGCGQDMTYSMDYRLEDHWAVLNTVRCQACTALARAHDDDQGKSYPQALRHSVALRHGWQDVLTTTPADPA